MFTREAIAKIRQVVRLVLSEHRNQNDARGQDRHFVNRWLIDGLLTEEMGRNGTASMNVYSQSDALTGETYDISDTGKIADGVTLPSGCAVTAGWCDGRWILLSYDCDLEDQS